MRTTVDRSAPTPADDGAPNPAAAVADWQLSIMRAILERTQPVRQLYMEATGGPALDDLVNRQVAGAVAAMARLDNPSSVADVIRDIEAEHTAGARSLDGRFQQITARLAILKREAPARARRLRELREERQRQPERFRGDALLDEMSRAIEAAQLPAVRLLENAASPERLVKRVRKAITATRRRRLTLQAAKTVVAFLVIARGFDRNHQAAEELGA